ncbi:Uma2 family endonuclease [Pseudofrankia saprophytica]|uniref:Uma2 family endonuclease n=1 Tax=Pseudofrankia saprophytica TaxID=298655 RepID=UPI000234B481|nr:Uma2 family endonuclease [Pseudofrankia saprophytica]
MTLDRPDDLFRGETGRYELIDGAPFVRAEPTPLLMRAINQIADALTDALRTTSSLVVAVFRPFDLDARNHVVPAISLVRDGAPVPETVIELRVESTARFALGPKRLLYGRAGIAEYCFADPQAGRMRVMRPAPARHDYAWPARDLLPGESYEPLCCPGVAVPVDVLLPDYLRRSPVGSVAA